MSTVIGRRYGMLVVGREVKKNVFLCQCDCGNTTEKKYHTLHHGVVKCCGCSHNGHKGVKRTNEQYIREATKVWGDLYDYNRVEYKTAKDNIEIFCKAHQEYFQVSAISHIKNKRGCQKCSMERRTKLQTGCKEDFIERGQVKYMHKVCSITLKLTIRPQESRWK